MGLRYPIGLYELKGAVVIITGAAAGIGRAVAEAYAEQGARLALVDGNPAVSELPAVLGDGHRGFAFDVREEDTIESTVRTVVEQFGRLDILVKQRRLVNNAGIGPLASAEDYSTDDWDRVMNPDIDIEQQANATYLQSVIPVERFRR